jgi:hypothetical protein
LKLKFKRELNPLFVMRPMFSDIVSVYPVAYITITLESDKMSNANTRIDFDFDFAFVCHTTSTNP